MNIHILSNRDIHIFKSSGVTGENNAEIMHFYFPEQIVGIDISKITKWIKFKNDNLDLLQMIENNEYSLTNLITQYKSVEYQVLLKYEEVILWKSKISELHFDESLDVDVTITLDDLSVLNQLKLQIEYLKKQYKNTIDQGSQDITKLIEQIKDLEMKINTAENVRIATEENRISAENERVKAEEKRNQELKNLIEKVNTVIGNLRHSIGEYNSNAEEQLSNLNSVANGAVSAVASAKKEALENIVLSKSNALDSMNEEKTTVLSEIENQKSDSIKEIDNHTETKINEYNANATDKTDTFDKNASTKTSAFNTNATNKTTAFNTNSINKTKEFNDNATEKLTKFNNNASDFERKHNYFTMLIEEEIEKETDVEIPFNYIVGNDEIVIFIDGIFMKCEKSEDDEANYREVGEPGTTSNKIQFGFNLLVGEELTIIKKGANEDDNG